MEMESDWISLPDELRADLESNGRHAEQVETELKLEKKCTEELSDALSRVVLGHARMVEHYAEQQEKYNDLVAKHQGIMKGLLEWRGRGERELLKKENKSLRIQLRDTAEAVHAAGELLVRLREAEQAVSVAEENFSDVQQENEKLKKQMEKLKQKHKMEMTTMKQYLAESRLPESAVQPLHREDPEVADNNIAMTIDDDQAWRANLGQYIKNITTDSLKENRAY
ncbi:hypothetical protein PTKIN_Ptkin11bG0191100 [Pterospermum kingtungense]